MGCMQSKKRRPPWGSGMSSNHEKDSNFNNNNNNNHSSSTKDVKVEAAAVAVVGSGGGGKKSKKVVVLKKIGGGDDYIDGWPKWLIDNIPKDVLDGLVPKSADSYDKLAKIGQGTYSNVYKARDRDSGKIVALKKVRFDTSEPESIKFMAREIMVLQKLDHPNIIKLEGIATSRMQYSLYLVFDYMLSDLTRVISRPSQRLTEPQVKCYMKQLLMGLQHCHERGILHRDIKGSNLLIAKDGTLKIADFGLANFFVPKAKRPLTTRVVTLWYRAPELLLGATDYGVGIDLWSAGCLLAEMFVGRPIMPGRTEVEQIHRIFKLCGSPAEDYWKIMRLPTSFRPPQHYKPSFQDSFKDMPSSSIALLTTLLSLNPSYRGTATSALQTQFFTTSPLACELSGLPVIQKSDDEGTRTGTRKNQEATPPPTSTFSQEPGLDNSTSSSTSSTLKPVKEEQQHHHHRRHPSFSPVERLPGDRSLRTEAHPNASKNIQNNNFTLLQASVSDILNPGPGMQHYRRSMSTLDFCALDPDKISKLFGLDDDHRGQLLHKNSFDV
ncbi:Probable serine/threonine-protein kinase At1g54610 [Linum perenne]